MDKVFGFRVTDSRDGGFNNSFVLSFPRGATLSEFLGWYERQCSDVMVSLTIIDPKGNESVYENGQPIEEVLLRANIDRCTASGVIPTRVHVELISAAEDSIYDITSGIRAMLDEAEGLEKTISRLSGCDAIQFRKQYSCMVEENDGDLFSELIDIATRFYANRLDVLREKLSNINV